MPVLKHCPFSGRRLLPSTEITSIEGTLEQVQGGALCSDKVCTPGCYEFLSELNKNLGCCWAELLTIASKVMGTDALLEDGTVGAGRHVQRERPAYTRTMHACPHWPSSASRRSCR